MKRKKGKRRQWMQKRKTWKLEEEDAGKMMKKKKKMDGTETTTEGDWSSSGVAELPLDVWGDIFSRLPFKQVLVCRCICRAWNALLARIHHHHHHPNPTTPAALLYYQLWPCLQDSQMRLGNYLTLAELRNGGASYLSTVTRVKDRYTCRGGADGNNFLRPVASCHGLVCFVGKIDRQRHNNIFVGNPLLKERLLLVRPSKIHMQTKGCQWSEVVGFGFSPGADRYKILTWFNADEQDQSHFLICNVGHGSRWCKGKRKRCPPKWRGLLSSPRHFCQHFCQKYSCRLGSHLNAGIHWLVSDKDDGSVFISRLDLDTEQFGRIEAPQSPDINATHLRGLSLGVSDGHLIICASLNLDGQDIIDIWVMNQFKLWTKNLVARSPITPDWRQRVEVLNYGKVEAAAKEGAVAEVMLLVVHLFAGSCRLYACTTRGRHVRQVDCGPGGEAAIVHIPSLLSIKDVIDQGLDGS